MRYWNTEAAVSAFERDRQRHLLDAFGGQFLLLRNVNAIDPRTSDRSVLILVLAIERASNKHKLVVPHEAVHIIRG